MNPDVNFYATGIQTIVKSGDCHGVSDENVITVTFVARKLKCTLKPGIIYMWRF